MKFSDKLYNTLKWLALIALPALGAFLSAVLPQFISADTVSIISTVISALIAFIGTLIGISTVAYNKDND